ncbi:MAG: bifunctional 5,10-methylene-tetrahydrofolate dehydrogenase/5,10-methylene-tetrahydrofolate cyclohydrolase [Spirochaetes bacterium GWF1_51_8]|nr:MAG: bifunctional 5,10-methylene-tetrahydrofolate dehydrogenase/5,10-methylene-tetrahydrofolate cyclohydrolase [Spirochaetes bacterium GWF1_51_8]
MILDGKALAALEREKIKAKAAELGIKPGLTVILVGEDPGSVSYVSSKEKVGAELGFASRAIRMPETASEAEVLKLIAELNRDPSVHGILVQLPLPAHIDENRVIFAIDPSKDVDCFHPYNFGCLLAGNQIVEPCTPKGVMRILDHYNIDLKGKRAVVVGRSNIVGKPVAVLLLQRHATVTIAHSRTVDLPAVCREADILVAAIGKPNMIGADYVKDGAVVIDVGTNRVDDASRPKGYYLTGDVDFQTVEHKASAITPSPGGVGPMTIAMLMSNTLELALLAREKKV